ncbi:MAG: RNA polymerase sigma factor, partial [bacterium]|nr:RNA polymerase sigma factor [bacterium]
MIYDENILIKQARAGSQRALSQIVRHHQNGVYSLALRMLGNREDAEDVLQETFLAFYKSLPRFKGLSSLSTYFYRLATNFSLMKLRQKKTRRPEHHTVNLEEAFEEPDKKPDPMQSALNLELKQRLDEALMQLPEKERAVFILRDVEDLPGEEVARVLKISLPAMKSRLHRARNFLKEKL